MLPVARTGGASATDYESWRRDYGEWLRVGGCRLLVGCSLDQGLLWVKNDGRSEFVYLSLLGSSKALTLPFQNVDSAPSIAVSIGDCCEPTPYERCLNYAKLKQRQNRASRSLAAGGLSSLVEDCSCLIRCFAAM